MPIQGDLQVRDLTGDDHDQAFDVRTRSFGKGDPSTREWWNTVQDTSIAQRRVLGVFDGDRLVGSAKARPFRQFWGGRPVAMAGIAGVVVAPEYRGRGVASLMLRSLAERAVELGDAVSALYPATVAPYRRSGWEMAGAQTRVSVDAHLLRGLGSAEVPVRQGTRQDVDLAQRLLRDRYSREVANGAKLLTEQEIVDSVAEEFAYFTDDGFVLYEWHEADLFVTCLVAESEASARALWGVVGSGSSVARRVHAFVSPDDPVHLLLPEEVGHDARQVRWMFRVLDPARAVGERGFPRDVTGSVVVELDDPLLPVNSGAWRLEVTAGRGSMTRLGVPGSPRDDEGAPSGPAGAPPVRLGARGLAGLYAGTPLHVLRSAGLVGEVPPETAGFLDAAFRGRAPYLLEYF